MSKMTPRKPLKTFWETMVKECFTGGQMRSLMIAVTPEFVEVKLKGTRNIYRIPWGIIYMTGVRMEVEAKKLKKEVK